MTSLVRYYFYGAASAIAIAGILHLMIVPNAIGRNPALGIFFLIVGAAQLFLTIIVLRRWGRNWHYIGIAGTIVLIIIFFVTRVPNPITEGRALPIDTIGIATELFEFAYVTISILMIVNQGRITRTQKEELR
jgi:hypothetical protein